MRLFHYTKILSICVFASLLQAHAALAAGFDCTKAKTQIELMICGDANVSALDSQLSAAFQSAMQKTPDRKALGDNQRNWLKNIRDLCKTIDCLNHTYRERIAYLEKPQPESKTAATGDVTCSVKSPEAPKPNCKTDLVCGTNSNQSILQAVVDQCAKAETRNIRVYFYETRNSKPVLLETLKDQEAQQVNFPEPDQNGYAQLDITSFCGAGPNCSHELYRYDPKEKALYKYFSGGYVDLSNFEGYLVESGRASCCSWEFRAHKSNAIGSRVQVDEKFFVISVSKDPEDEKKPADCSFFEYIGKDGATIRSVKPPSKKWLSYCEHYGPYKLR
ncbi:MAG: DUF1311 domain-containing protein [Burkholderiales bacterium]|nr:DUF1311 domain-containing protein [Burkholderiales bacterium]